MFVTQFSIPKSRKDKLHVPTVYPTHQVTEGQVAYPFYLHQPPAPIWFRKDKLHILTVCPNHQVTEGHVIYPYHLHHPNDYGRTKDNDKLHILTN